MMNFHGSGRKFISKFSKCFKYSKSKNYTIILYLPAKKNTKIVNGIIDNFFFFSGSNSTAKSKNEAGLTKFF